LTDHEGLRLCDAAFVLSLSDEAARRLKTSTKGGLAFFVVETPIHQPSKPLAIEVLSFLTVNDQKSTS